MFFVVFFCLFVCFLFVCLFVFFFVCLFLLLFFCFFFFCFFFCFFFWGGGGNLDIARSQDLRLGVFHPDHATLTAMVCGDHGDSPNQLHLHDLLKGKSVEAFIFFYV